MKQVWLKPEPPLCDPFSLVTKLAIVFLDSFAEET
jgi:hypothetical protein